MRGVAQGPAAARPRATAGPGSDSPRAGAARPGRGWRRPDDIAAVRALAHRRRRQRHRVHEVEAPRRVHERPVPRPGEHRPGQARGDDRSAEGLERVGPLRRAATGVERDRRHARRRPSLQRRQAPQQAPDVGADASGHLAPQLLGHEQDTAVAPPHDVVHRRAPSRRRAGIGVELGQPGAALRPR